MSASPIVCTSDLSSHSQMPPRVVLLPDDAAASDRSRACERQSSSPRQQETTAEPVHPAHIGSGHRQVGRG